MAKKKIKFKLTDGMQPRKLDMPGKPFGLRLPMSVNLPVRTSKEVSLGISCELPVLVVPTLLSAALHAEARIIAPGEQLKVVLTSGLEPVNIGEGEVVARAYVIDNTDMELD